jgi:hypothetical protein
LFRPQQTAAQKGLAQACRPWCRPVAQLKKSADQGGGWGAPAVRAQLAMLSRQWPAAEALLLAQGKADDAIAMYKQLHRCGAGGWTWAWGRGVGGRLPAQWLP